MKSVICLSLSLSLTGLLTVSVSAQSASITWSPVQTISGPSDVSTLGTFVGDWSPLVHAIGTPSAVNGVNFVGNNLAGFSTTLGETFGSFGDPGTSSAAYNSILEWANYIPSSALQNAVAFGGLKVGDTYQVELWVEDLRGGYNNRAETFSAAGVLGDRSGTLTFGGNNGPGVSRDGYGQFVIGTFVANAAGTEQIDVSANGQDVVQLNLFELRNITSTIASGVPDKTSTIALLTCSAAAMLGCFRRRVEPIGAKCLR